ncbi:MAG: serine hydrolase, partial [Bacteroidota bacterium]
MDALDATLTEAASAYPGLTFSVSVRDSLGLSYDFQGDRVYHAASTMKVPVMIELFKQAEAGTFALDDSILVENEFFSIVDSSRYSMSISEDADEAEAIYGRLGEPMPIRELNEQMITVSSNLATNILIGLVGAENAQQTVRDLGAETMLVLRGVEDIKAFRQGLSNTATSSDLAEVLAALMRHDIVSAAADEEMIQVMARQQYNSMIPRGVPDGSTVAHKTGWITGIRHDAGIVYPPDSA